MKTNKKIIAIISARLNSKRLRNKTLIDCEGEKILDIVIRNIKGSSLIEKIIVATSKNPEDLKIFKYCKSKNISCFRGEEKNLIKRFYDSAKKYQPKYIVRVTADNPFVSHEITDFMIKSHLKKKADFSFMNKKDLPSGVCPEIISFSSLKKIMNFNLNFNYSEYMTFYFTNNPKMFNLNKINPLDKFKFKDNKLRLTLDYKEDLILINKILNLLKKIGPIKLSEIYKIVKKFPYLININKKLKVKWKTDKILINKIKKASKIFLK